MRTLAAMIAAALLAGSAAAQTVRLVNLPGDFDGDGKADRVERNVASNGAWRIWVWLATSPDHALGIYESDDLSVGAEPIEVKPAGTYKVLFEGKTGEMTFANDVILTLRMPSGRSLTFWKDGRLQRAYLVE